MDAKWQSIFPNPFSKDARLPGTAAKAESLVEGMQAFSLIKSLFGLVFLSYVFVTFFSIPFLIVIVFFGLELVTMIINLIFIFKKISALQHADHSQIGKALREILIINSFYDCLRTGVQFAVISLGALLLYNMLINRKIPLAPVTFGQITIDSDTIPYIFILSAVFRLLNFIVKYAKYLMTKSLPISPDYAETQKNNILLEKKIEIIRFFPEMSVFVVILVILGLPWYIPFIFGCIVLLFLLLSVIEFKRLQNVNINISMLDERTVQHTIHTNENESISGAVYGILKGAASFRDIFKPTGVAILGSGKSYYPENTLLLTNVRLLFVYVPVTGGNTIIGPTNYVSQNFFFNRGEIRQKGEAMVKNTPLPEIVKFAIDDIYYADIRKCTLKKMKLTVETNDGKKVSYTFLDNEYIAVLQPLLQHYLGERAICKN